MVEHAETVELEKGSTGLGLSAEDPIGFKDGGDEEEEVQVAKKARVEKAVNGNNEAVTDAGEEEGVESVEKEDDEEPELDPLLAHNGNNNDDEERINGEGDDKEDSVGAAAEDDEDGGEPLDGGAPGVTSKEAGDVGLRTLLQDGDTTKTAGGLVNGTEDATHKLNGAK